MSFFATFINREWEIIKFITYINELQDANWFFIVLAFRRNNHSNALFIPFVGVGLGANRC